MLIKRFYCTHSIERLWKDQFDYLYREYDTFVFPMSIHPQVSGKPQVILMHERIIEYISKHEGVEWVTMEEMVKEFKEGRIGGVEVKGGVDL
jgi:peptidoglycan/xylan/chitin deacetylase (PgdA/CDA1 family)